MKEHSEQEVSQSPNPFNSQRGCFFTKPFEGFGAHRLGETSDKMQKEPPRKQRYAFPAKHLHIKVGLDKECQKHKSQIASNLNLQGH